MGIYLRATPLTIDYVIYVIHHLQKYYPLRDYCILHYYHNYIFCLFEVMIYVVILIPCGSSHQ